MNTSLKSFEDALIVRNVITRVAGFAGGGILQKLDKFIDVLEGTKPGNAVGLLKDAIDQVSRTDPGKISRQDLIDLASYLNLPVFRVTKDPKLNVLLQELRSESIRLQESFDQRLRILR